VTSRRPGRAGRITCRYDIAGHGLNSRLCRVPVCTHPVRLFCRNQAITALTLAERLAAGYGDDDPFVIGWPQGAAPVTDRLIRLTTTLAVVAVAVVAAIISYQHAYELVTSHGESGLTARLLPFTVDGLIWAASVVVLDASRRRHPVPALAKWSLAIGIVATIGANLAHGLNHGPVGALVSAWPALALVGSFDLLMLLIGTHQRASSDHVTSNHSAPPADSDEPPAAPTVPSLEHAVRTWHAEGRSQRSIARDLNINHRRKVKQIINCDAA
jgi:hypothetical protein